MYNDTLEYGNTQSILRRSGLKIILNVTDIDNGFHKLFCDCYIFFSPHNLKKPSKLQ